MRVTYCDVCGVEIRVAMSERIELIVGDKAYGRRDACSGKCSGVIKAAFDAAAPGPGRDENGKVGKDV